MDATKTLSLFLNDRLFTIGVFKFDLENYEASDFSVVAKEIFCFSNNKEIDTYNLKDLFYFEHEFKILISLLKTSNEMIHFRTKIKPYGQNIVKNIVLGPIRVSDHECFATVRTIDREIGLLESFYRSEEQYRTIVEGVNNAIILSKKGGRIIYANPPACKLFGTQLNENIDIIKLSIHPDDSTKILEILQSRDNTINDNLCYRLIGEDKNIQWVNHTWFTVKTSSENQHLFIDVLENVTEYMKRKKLEEENIRINEELLKMKEKELDEEKHNKVRMEDELKMAKVIQNALIPPNHVILKNIEMASYYTQSTECGGDWWGYQYIQSKDLLILSMADVTGHGAAAAVVTAIAKGCISTLNEIITKSENKEITPKEILDLYNRVIFDSTKGALYMTCFTAILDLKTGVLNYSNAAHNLPIVLLKESNESLYQSKANNIPHVYLNAKGDPVGVKENPVYENQTYTIKKDDILVLYTDGIIECTNAEGTALGKKKLIKTLNKYKDESLSKMCDNTVFDCYDFYNSDTLADDITLVLIKYS